MAQDFSRRSFLRLAATSGTAAAIAACTRSKHDEVFSFLEPFNHDNPLTGYPNRDWEKQYRDLFAYDSTFNFLCAPNDTHNCLLTTYVKNGEAVRIGPSYGYGKATDIYGNKTSARWDPRCCEKGLALVRRFYGDRRCKEPMARQGFLDWINSDFERDPKTGAIPKKYMNRGRDPYVPISWDQAYKLSAQAMHNIAKTYTGKKGQDYLSKQGYDPAMVEETQGAGTQVMKFRGGMAALGATRLFAQYRLSNMMALLDTKLRDVDEKTAVGGRGWDNYSWHTDLPPGHPMVTGQQTNDFDLACAEHAKLIIPWGMNWITTKMPDSHWLTEAKMKGTKVWVIAAEYSGTTSKADKALVVRPGTTPALALGLCYKLLKRKQYNPEFLKSHTDMTFLVRTDTLKFVQAKDVWSDYQAPEPKNYLKVLQDGEKVSPLMQASPQVTKETVKEWGDYVVYDQKTKSFKPHQRDAYGESYKKTGMDCALNGEYDLKLANGSTVKVKPVFELLQKYIYENFDPKTVSEITWAPEEGLEALAQDLHKYRGETLFTLGMGPNQFFNSDLKDRDTFFLAALTENIGKKGGNIGSYAGNYRASFFSGLGQFIKEDPFNVQLDEKKFADLKGYFKAESVHYFNHGDTILRQGDEILTGKSHMPTPTKSILVSNSNSLIGNAKGHYDTVMNVLPKVEFIGVNEWWWTASCEYADIVFPVDSWAEFKQPDATISVTNPFLYIFPRTPLKRIFNTQHDIEVAAGIGRAMGDVLDDPRCKDYWKFVTNDRVDVYAQRIFDLSNSTKGYDFLDLEKKAQAGIPALLMTRTSPKVGGWEQTNEDKPYYTKSGRLEFYRDEHEFIEAGENMPVYREPIDSTFYEPNVIVGKKHEAIRGKTPEEYGVDPNDLEGDARQARNVLLPWELVRKTTHPLDDKGFKFIFHTPKYRHGAHTTPIDTDIVAVWFGPFGDPYRRDKRMPFVAEAFLDINPLDARELGIDDGDYIYVDADPHDRPFRNWQKADKRDYETARLLCRARYYPGTPRRVTRMWHNMYGATFGSMEGAKEREDGLAKNPRTGYQSLFRGGSHQSCTRGWLKPTWMTDTLARKDLIGQQIGKGFAPDVHCPTGAPREAFVKITKAEKGSIDGKQAWGPAREGLRPTYESDALKAYMSGSLVEFED